MRILRLARAASSRLDPDIGPDFKGYGAILATSLKQRHPPVMYGAPAGLADNASQSRTDNLAGLELQSRRQHTDYRDTELRARQIKRVDCNTTRFQSFENMLQA